MLDYNLDFTQGKECYADSGIFGDFVACCASRVQGPLLSPKSRCTGSERRGSVFTLGSSLPGTPDALVVDADVSTPHGTVLSNSALVAGNVSVLLSNTMLCVKHSH